LQAKEERLGAPVQKPGLKGRSFSALMVTQFLGAANDNAFKLVVTFLLLATITGGVSAQIPYMSAVGALFVIPFLLFSTWSGWLADRLSKRTVLVLAKAGEVAVMALAVLALWHGSLWACLPVLFLMGAQSTVFSPAKYGILPEILADEELSQGNGIIEMLTDIAIILGMVGGGVLFDAFSGRLAYAGLVFLAIAAAGMVASLFVEKVPAAGTAREVRLNFLCEMWGNIRAIRKDRALWLSVLGVSFFWLMGACFQLNFTVYANSLLGASSSGTGGLLALSAVGIGAGALLAGKLSGKKVEFGLVPIGAAMMAIFCIVLAFSWDSVAKTSFAVLFLGVGAGLYLIPLAAFVQQQAPADQKGMVLATNNFMTFSGILLASALYFFAGRALQMDPAEVFLLLALLVVGVTGYLFTLLPDFLLRFCVWVLIRSFYRMRVEHPERVPRKGGALLVCNHVSGLDGELVLASIQRFVRFVMFRRHYQYWWLNWGCRILKVIPISETDGVRQMVRSLRTATEAIRSGELVGIFAEGRVTRTGNMFRFKRGFEKIMKGLDAPVIPVHIDRMWGSIFSYEGGRPFWKWPGLYRSKVTVSYGEPLPATATAAEVRQAVSDLGAEAFKLRKADQVLLHEALIASARSVPRRMAMADSSGTRLTYGGVLTKSFAIADLLRRELPNEEMVGVVLPASVAGAVMNAGLLLAGKVPVNLNFTTGEETFRSSMDRCGIRTVVTGRAFMKKVPLPAEPDRTIFAEDLPDLIGKWNGVKAALKAHLVPQFFLRRLYGMRGRSVEELATVIFSSGSTGQPKGIMLTHSNIMSDIDGLGQAFGMDERDRICGVLPFFHSFGFTATIWFPLIRRMSVVYHPNPLEGPAVGALVREFGATMLLATPTFLRIYIRSALPGDFGSLKNVVVGAEKLRDELAERFREKFGIRPVEGYGCTECAPVVSVNGPDFRARGIVQIGTKPGTIGQPLPGIAVRIVDPETGEPLPVGEDGLLLVKGANVMKGYLGQPDKTAEVLRDGWYNTGDIARLDEDGFLTITDRLSRFSKIGGEMVPHLKVEEAIARAIGPQGEAAELLIAVAGVPDEKKGEMLVVLHKTLPISVDEILSRLKEAGLPNLWIPARQAFYEVAEMPMLGTGKLDLEGLKAMAMEACRT
jgi:acyl-[acyl-carrier-protein]-phospholipid O-acyltransferase/long-chain-fatty-acid--[acyl-carrier-protein] ligase